jgi:bifunctional UDP-N-acetylglucosamine pyrophosphorylase/glucosamine-1-phosphate N-acetyltransferase
MKSDLPKVLHQMGGRSLIEWVLHSLAEIQPVRRLVIVGYGGNLVRESLSQLQESKANLPPLEFVEQREQLGTGHAAQQLLPYLEGFQGNVLVLNGDVPLLRPQTLKRMLQSHQDYQSPATILAAHVPDPKGYGRVFCNGQNELQQIVEDRDCTPAQKQNRRVNAGVYCFQWEKLAQILPKLTANNDQKEYYITDAVNYLQPTIVVDLEDYQEILGVNDRQQLATAYSILQARIKNDWMKAGVTLVDPDSVTIDDTVQLEADVVIEPQTHLRGHTVIRSGSRVGPGSLIENSQIGANATVLYSVVTESAIADEARVGPYAHLRGHAVVGSGCRIGNFVELKNTTLGDRTNVAHLSYLGDAILGTRVNIGGGTITANYDGIKKHRTTIGDRSKTGVNNSLVAPLTIGEDVTIAAGSTITDDLPDDCLAIARSRQVVKPGWRLKPKSDSPTE